MAQTIKLKRSATAGAAPTTSQLELGEVAINTYDGKMYIKKSVGGTESIVEISGGGASAADAIFEEYLYTATNNQTAFTGNDDNSSFLSYVSGAIQVFLNGVLLDPETDYTATNGATVTLTSGAATGDYLQIIAFKKKIGDGSVTIDTFSGNNSTTAFTLSLDPGDENNTRVFIDGVYQSKSNYTVSGTTLTFSSAPPSGTGIEVEIGNRAVSLDTTTSLDLPDNVKLRLGTSQDLEIYHDGSHSRIKDTGTGNLILNTQAFRVNGADDAEGMIKATQDGNVELYHNGSKKFETTSTGITVTGVTTSSGLNIINTSSFASTATFADGAEVRLGADNDMGLFHSSGVSHIRVNSGTFKLRADDMRFTAQNGTSEFARFESNGNLLIGKTSTGLGTAGVELAQGGTSGKVWVTRSGGEPLALNRTGSGGTILDFFKDGSSVGTIGSNSARFYIHNNYGSGAGLRFDNASIRPATSAGASEDNTTDLGASGARFKDLFLGGTISSGTITTTGELRGPASFTIDPAAVGDNTGTVVIKGNLQVDGATTTINSTTLTVDDLNITLASGAANGTAANGAGITVDGASATLTYNSTGDSWDFNKAVSTGNMTLSGQEIDVSSGDLTLDVAGDILLDADGGNLKFADAGVIKLDIYQYNSNLYFDNPVSDSDIIFQGVDGSTSISALTLDMSDEGAATFNNTISSGAITSSGSLKATDYRVNEGNSLAGGLFKEKNVTGSGGSNDLSIFAESISNGGNIHFMTGGSPTIKATINSSGNVGIGTTTPDEFSIGSTYKYLAVGGDKPGIINLVDSGTSGSYLQFGTAAGVRRASIHTDNGSDVVMTLNSSNSGTSLTERFRIKASTGNVGIGNQNPASRLHISGGNLLLDNALEVRTKDTGGTVRTVLRANSSNELEYGWSANAPVKFMGGGSYAERMRIHTNGNIGIGTTSPLNPLHVKQSNGSHLLALETAYVTNRSVRGQLSWRDSANITGGIWTEYDGSQVSMRFGNLYNSGYNTNTSMIIRGNGNVGIGTDSPAQTLHVSSTGTTSNGIRISNSEGSFETRVDQGEFYLYDVDDNRIPFLIDTTGNVGIGTTSPSANLEITQSGNNVGLLVAGGGYNYTAKFESVDAEANIIIEDSNSTNDGNMIGVATNDMYFITDTAERMRIDSSGNVVINKAGFSSLPTGSKLNIFGDGVSLRLDGSSQTTKSILFRQTSVANPGEMYADGSLRFRTEDANTRITFHTNSSGSDNERMRIDSAGKTKIMTSTSSVAAAHSAADELQIVGDGVVSGITISNISDAGTGTLFFGDTSSATAAGIRYNHNTGDMAISAEDFITMETDGLGIGTTLPNSKLEVNNPSGAGNGSAQEVGRFVNTGSGANSMYLYLGASSGTDWRLGKNVTGIAGNVNFSISDHVGSRKLDLTTSGTLGLGTTTPITPVHKGSTVTASQGTGNSWSVSSSGTYSSRGSIEVAGITNRHIGRFGLSGNFSSNTWYPFIKRSDLINMAGYSLSNSEGGFGIYFRIWAYTSSIGGGEYLSNRVTETVWVLNYASNSNTLHEMRVGAGFGHAPNTGHNADDPSLCPIRMRIAHHYGSDSTWAGEQTFEINLDYALTGADPTAGGKQLIIYAYMI